MSSSGARSVLDDAISIHLADPTIASPFAARWCVGQKAESTDGLFRIREDEARHRVGVQPH